MPYWYEENARLLEKYEDAVPPRTGWGAEHWSRIQGAEHLAMRDSVGLFDLTTLAPIEISGNDALAFTQYACTNQMDIDIGAVQYTLLCTPNGGIKRDLTVARLETNRFWLFTGNGTLPQEIDWLKRLARDKYDVAISDLSHRYATLGLFGPNARKVLAETTGFDVSNDNFPFYTWRRLNIGMASVFSMRISYVGELGYELYINPDEAIAVRQALWDAGKKHNITACGVGAMRSMRFEKGYRLWGSDIYTEHNPYEAGMGWLVKLKKGDFVGRDALQKIRANIKTNGLDRRLVTLTIDDPNCAVMGNEPIYSNGSSEPTVIGQVTSGNYGYSAGKYIAFGYVPTAYTTPGTHLTVEYLGESYPAVVSADCLFDPENARLKA